MSAIYESRSDDRSTYQNGALVPAARPLNEFSMERVGNDVVLYDDASMQYHTLNDLAYRVWRHCESATSVGQIVTKLAGEGVNAPVEVVELAVAQLVDAGLMQSDAQSVDVRMQRRKVLKLAAVGAIAAVAVPVVSSITAPEASAQNSGLICPDGKKCPITKCCCCHPADQGGGFDNCDCSCDSGSGGEDCSTPGLAKVCVC